MIRLGEKTYNPVGYTRISMLTAAAESVTLYQAGVSGGGGLFVSTNTTFVRGVQAYGEPVPISTNAATTSASGGVGPYTYAWTAFDSGDGWTINTPTSASTGFTSPPVAPNDAVGGQFICTATDARGRTGTVTVTAAAENYGDLRGGEYVVP